MRKLGLLLTTTLLLGACGLNPQQSQTRAADKAGHILPVRPDISAIGKPPSKPLRPAARVAATVKPAARQVAPAAKPQTDLWQRVRQGYQLSHIDHSRIDQQRRWYTRHPEYIERVSKRAQPYLYYIVSELSRRNMPMELALLPVVESAFDPFAYSHGRASGLWQFTPPTARDFKLANTWWYDGRRDVQASTTAALDYLQQLNRRFDGDWLLALAAYNAGGGTVSKAMRKNRKRGKDTDFWSLSLPKETRAYVPRLLAMAEIVARPGSYRVSLVPAANRPYFERFDLPYQLDLAQAAKLARLPIEEIHRLNPGYNRWATAPSGAQHLLIPVGRADEFRHNLSQLSADQRVAGRSQYRVEPGDTLSQIAEKHGVRTAELRQLNKLAGSVIRPGQSLQIPRSGRPLGYRGKVAEASPRRASAASHYRVKRGDTLWNIARRFGVDHRELARWNQLNPKGTLKPGQRLRLQRGGAKAAAPGLTKIRYKVRKGDSIAAIARRFGTSVASIVRANDLNPEHYLRPGQALTLLVKPQRS